MVPISVGGHYKKENHKSLVAKSLLSQNRLLTLINLVKGVYQSRNKLALDDDVQDKGGNPNLLFVVPSKVGLKEDDIKSWWELKYSIQR